jgi:hypothetical protein
MQAMANCAPDPRRYYSNEACDIISSSLQGLAGVGKRNLFLEQMRYF